jgi:hypothetical protein
MKSFRCASGRAGGSAGSACGFVDVAELVDIKTPTKMENHRKTIGKW